MKYKDIDFNDFDWEEKEEESYEDYPKNFKEFLIENDALEKYHNTVPTSYNLKTFFRTVPKLLWITPFSWGNEEWHYWTRLNSKWIHKRPS